MYCLGCLFIFLFFPEVIFWSVQRTNKSSCLFKVLKTFSAFWWMKSVNIGHGECWWPRDSSRWGKTIKECPDLVFYLSFAGATFLVDFLWWCLTDERKSLFAANFGIKSFLFRFLFLTCEILFLSNFALHCS